MAKQFAQKSAFDKISMDQIISAPLQATATANSMMAKEQIKFLMEFCFKKTEENFEPVMIDMFITGTRMEPGEGPDDELEMKAFTTKFSLPLLTLIPISSLAVESFEIDFDMEVTSVEKSAEKSTDPTQDGEGDHKLQLMGKVSNKGEQVARNSQYQKKVDSKLSINVKGGQLPLPVGLTSILEIYKNNIVPVEVKKQKSND